MLYVIYVACFGDTTVYSPSTVIVIMLSFHLIWYIARCPQVSSSRIILIPNQIGKIKPKKSHLWTQEL